MFFIQFEGYENVLKIMIDLLAILNGLIVCIVSQSCYYDNNIYYIHIIAYRILLNAEFESLDIHPYLSLINSVKYTWLDIPPSATRVRCLGAFQMFLVSKQIINCIALSCFK